MAIKDFIKKQFIDVIQWTESGDGQIAIRYPMQDCEIQNGAQLTVRESQMAVFVNEGKIADVFGPGLYTLTTRTLPLLTNLKNWDKLFQSPFKADVYFFSTRLQVDRKWEPRLPSLSVTRTSVPSGSVPSESIRTRSLTPPSFTGRFRGRGRPTVSRISTGN